LDESTHQPIGVLTSGEFAAVNQIVFSPDGKTLALGGNDYAFFNPRVEIWDVKTRKQIGDALPFAQGDIANLAFSPDGSILAIGSYDATISLWDVATRQTIGKQLVGDAVYDIAFDQSGTTLASVGGLDVLLWDLDPESWIQNSCQRAGRNFTQAEWSFYFPGAAYRIVCPQWPSGP